jgi:Cu(I)/Ag(I) efflux system membrane protein CusA/SilA
LLKGKLRPENKIQFKKNGKYIYAHFDFCLKWKISVLAVNIVALLIGGLMFTQLGSEFMPPLDEGSILFMPVTCLMFLIQK